MLFGTFNVRGHSMLPIFNEEDVVFVSSIPYFFTKPKVGDVIIFQYDKKKIMKRIEEIKDEKYFVKGDNDLDTKKFDYLTKNKILGRVIFKI